MEHKIHMTNEWEHVEQLCDIQNDANKHCYKLYQTIYNTLLEERKRNNPNDLFFKAKILARFACILRPG